MLDKYPRPWRVEPLFNPRQWCIVSADNKQVALFAAESRELADQIVLWANAEDVQMRRGWTTTRWQAPNESAGLFGAVIHGWWPSELLGFQNNAQPTPALALTAADAWLREQEAKERTA